MRHACQQSLVTFHLNLLILQNYVALNFTAIAKILKKFDKKLGLSLRTDYISAIVELPFYQASTTLCVPTILPTTPSCCWGCIDCFYCRCRRCCRCCCCCCCWLLLLRLLLRLWLLLTDADAAVAATLLLLSQPSLPLFVLLVVVVLLMLLVLLLLPSPPSPSLCRRRHC